MLCQSTRTSEADRLWNEFQILSLQDNPEPLMQNRHVGFSNAHGIGSPYSQMKAPGKILHAAPEKRRIISPTLGPTFEYVDPGNFSLSAPSSPLFGASSGNITSRSCASSSTVWSRSVPHSPMQQQETPPGLKPPVLNLNTAESKDALKQQKKLQMEAEVSARYAGVKLSDVTGKVLSFCKDQQGCRFLQKLIDDHGDAAVTVILKEILDKMVDLMIDPFANYLVQKLTENCSDQQRTVIVKKVAPGISRAAKNSHGTRASQKLIENITTLEQVRVIVRALEKDVISLVKDLNSNHLIQKCLTLFPTEENKSLHRIIINHCVEVATDRHGCCVLQRCIDHAPWPEKMEIISVVTEHALSLVQSPFGNYVVQYILDSNDLPASLKEDLIEQFMGHIYELSMQKFSSNVIEKCLANVDSRTRRRLLSELIVPGKLHELIKGNYSNYVLQTALEVADEDQRTYLTTLLKHHLVALKGTPSGKRILTKLQLLSKSK